MKMIYENQSLSKPSIVYNTGVPFSKKYKKYIRDSAGVHKYRIWLPIC